MRPYPTNISVCTVNRAALESSLLASAPDLSPEHLANLGQVDKIKEVRSSDAGMPSYSLCKIPGIWPHWSLKPFGRRVTVNAARPFTRVPGSLTLEIPIPMPSVLQPNMIYIGGLPYGMSETSLLRLFIKFGNVKEVSLPIDSMTGRSKGFAHVQMADTVAFSTVITELNGKEILENGEHASDYELGSTAENDNSDIGKLAVVQIIETASRDLATLICNKPGIIQHLEWRDLERILAVAFDGIGYSVRLTPGAKDGGKDIVVGFVASGKVHSYYVEVKHWVSGKKVGKGHIKEFLSVIVRDQQEGGILVSTSGFAASAMQGITAIERKKLRFGNSNNIVTLCRTYLNVAQGLLYRVNYLDALISHTQNPDDF